MVRTIFLVQDGDDTLEVMAPSAEYAGTVSFRVGDSNEVNLTDEQWIEMTAFMIAHCPEEQALQKAIGEYKEATRGARK